MGLKADEMNIDKRDENSTDPELISKTDDRNEQVPLYFIAADYSLAIPTLLVDNLLSFIFSCRLVVES